MKRDKTFFMQQLFMKKYDQAITRHANSDTVLVKLRSQILMAMTENDQVIFNDETRHFEVNVTSLRSLSHPVSKPCFKVSKWTIMKQRCCILRYKHGSGSFTGATGHKL